MAGSITVIEGDLDSLAGQLNAGYGELQQLNSKIAQQVAAVTQAGGWSGGGATAASEAMANWGSGIAQAEQALQALASLVKSAAAQYGDTDAAIQSSFVQG
jgi:WXG100 family type VII secretion target